MIAVLGGTGYIGEAFLSELTSRGINFVNYSRKDLNYYNYDLLYEKLKLMQPKFLINCAGYTGKPNVDACEKNREECYVANVNLPNVIQAVCSALDIPWGHVSSGCIFQGYPDGGFTEEDEPNLVFGGKLPASYYSACKDLGEKTINLDSAYCWRLRIPFDNIDSPRNYITKMLTYPRLLEAKNSVSHRGDFAKACLDLYLCEAPYGIYNVTNTGHVTTKGVVEKFKKFLDVSHRTFDFWEDDKVFYRDGAEAPRSNCILNNDKLTKYVQIRSVDEALEDSLKNWSNTLLRK